MLNFHQILPELEFRSSRSSGPGGQHVNKVSTRITLLFNVVESAILSNDEKYIILKKLKNRISNDGLLSLNCDETRSQSKNKEIVIERFKDLIETALKPVKQRKPTRPSKGSVERRLKNKKVIAGKKESRKTKPEDD